MGKRPYRKATTLFWIFAILNSSASIYHIMTVDGTLENSVGLEQATRYAICLKGYDEVIYLSQSENVIRFFSSKG